MEGLPGHPVRRSRRRARRRAQDLLSGSAAVGRRIVLLRHGRTGDNAAGRIQGQLDTPLDEVGRAQAEQVAPHLAALRPALLLTSDLARAAATAVPLANATGLVPVVDARLRELDLGSWQGLVPEQVRERFPAEHAAWRAGRDVARGGGETYRQAGERAAACLAQHLEDLPAGRVLLAVTHGGTARATVGLLLELPAATWGRLAPLGNTCWSVLVETDRGWRLEQHGAQAGPLPVTGPAHAGARAL